MAATDGFEGDRRPVPVGSLERTVDPDAVGPLWPGNGPGEPATTPRNGFGPEPEDVLRTLIRLGGNGF